MKRYLILGGSDYYAEGGFHDFLSSHDTLNAAEQCAKQYKGITGKPIDWWHIFDSESKMIESYKNRGDPEERPSLREYDPEHYPEIYGPFDKAEDLIQSLHND